MHNEPLKFAESGQVGAAKKMLGDNGTGPSSWASLTSKTQVATVEHAIANLRNGFPIIIRGNNDGGTLVTAAETARLDALEAALKTPGNGLVIPATRLRYAGIDTQDPKRFDISGWTLENLSQAVFSPIVSLSENGQNVSIEEEAAIHLLKLAQLLPTAITVAVPANVDVSHLVSVDAGPVLNHHENVAHCLAIVARTQIPLAECEATEFVLFHGSDGLKDQLALVIGSPDTSGPVPVRVHSACLSGDLYGSLKCDCGDQLRGAVAAISKMGGGVLLYLDQEGRGIGLRNKMRAYRLQEHDFDTVDADALIGYGIDERRYGIAQRMLELLGYHDVLVLTNNPEKADALSGSTIRVVGTERLHGSVNPYNARYLATKVQRAGHLPQALG